MVKTLSVYTTGKVAVATVLTLLLGGLIVTATKWGVNMSSFETKTVKTEQFAPEIGNLTLSATLVAENEVTLNLTFSGTGGYNHLGYVWTIWVSNSSIPNYRNLPEGLELVEGTLMENVSCPVPGSFLSFQATLRTIVDGEWTVYGLFSATAGPGFYHGLSSSGIQITTSKGRIVQLEKEQCQHQPPSPSGSENQQVSPYH